MEQLRTETDPVFASAIALTRIARSQAFAEGNKRTARIAPFLPRGALLKMVRNMQSPAT